MKKKSQISVGGYDFICKNAECKYCNTAITFHEPWPITSIEEVLKIKTLPPEHTESLANKLKEGCKYALIIYPNKNNLKQVGWRHQYYCPECYVIWEEDTLLKDKKVEMHNCNRCGSKVRNLIEIVEKGILCPSCQKPLERNMWMTKPK